MGGKPLYTTIGTAKSRPAVFGLCDNDGSAALPALKGARHRLARSVLRVLPVQPFAAGRAEFYPFVGVTRHDDDRPAAQTAEGAQRLSSCRMDGRRFVPMAIGVPAAEAAAVPLRRPIGCKLLAAHGAYRLPFHQRSDLPVHADVKLIRVFVVIAEGLFHVEEHVRSLAELMGEAEAYVVPGAFIFVRRIEAARIVEGADILIA